MQAYSRWILGALLVLSPLWSGAAFGDNAAVNDDSAASFTDASCFPSVAERTERLVRRLNRLNEEVRLRESQGRLAGALQVTIRNFEHFYFIVSSRCDRRDVLRRFDRIRSYMREVRDAWELSALRSDDSLQRRYERMRMAWRDLRDAMRDL